MKILNPTVTFQVGDIARVPYVEANESANVVADRIRRLVEIAKRDWDSAELSWGFQRHPLIEKERPAILESYVRFSDECSRVTLDAKRLEEDNNMTFVNAYKLAEELAPDVDLSDIALRANRVHRWSAPQNLVQLLW